MFYSLVKIRAVHGNKDVLADFDRNKFSLGLKTQLCRLPGRNFLRKGSQSGRRSSIRSP
jgi:hypothetical protein